MRVFACAPCADGLEQLGEKVDENLDMGIWGDEVPRVWILVCPIKQETHPSTAKPFTEPHTAQRRVVVFSGLSQPLLTWYPTLRTDSQAKFRRIV